MLEPNNNDQTKKEVLSFFESEAAKRERAARHARCRRPLHVSECEDVPPSFEDVVRAAEEDR